ncbi:MAG: beta-ketoacyl-ACP synthase 3 [Dysgonomonas sp.]|nr:beta-ketoacyl-ACP synthase 3 [Dysgonomonas sp.]
MNATITSIGAYHPAREIDNNFFKEYIETSDEWIRERTGIVTRYFAAEDEFTTDLCVKATQDLAEKYNKDLSDIDFIIVATSTPDHIIPSVASQVQARLNIPNAGAIDISCACAGFVNGVILAKGLIAANTHKKVLVIGAEALSKAMDLYDRATCILFGDGAGAVLVEASEENFLYDTISGTDGNYGKDLYIAYRPIKVNGVNIDANGMVHQNGRTVYKWAIQTLAKGVKRLADVNNVSLDEIDYFIPHSANYRLLEAVFAELNISMDKCLDSVRKYGNTSAASVPLAWYEGVKEGKLKIGDKVFLIGFGGGFTYGGIYIHNQIARW